MSEPWIQAEQVARVSQPPRRRRRWPTVLLVLVLIAILLFLGAVWYASSLLGAGLSLERPEQPENLTIVAAGADTVAYDEATAEGAWKDIGLMAVGSAAGGWYATTGPQGTDPTVRRITKEVHGPALAPGQAARLDGTYFFSDPRAGLGLPFQEVSIQTPGGPAPAWYVPGERDRTTWVIFTHGRGADRREGLRALSTTGKLGYPTLLISYLGDEGAPQGNGYGQIGAAEWPDLQAAAQYAEDHGAQRLFLIGNSMGGAITLAFLKNSDLADDVVGVFLDSPVADFGQAVDLNARARGIPSVVTDAGKLVARIRFGSDFADTDYTAAAAEYPQPMVVTAGTADTLVPAQIGQDLVDAVNAAHPGTAEFALFDGADHTAEWNVDRPRYDRLLAGLLARTTK